MGNSIVARTALVCVCVQGKRRKRGSPESLNAKGQLVDGSHTPFSYAGLPGRQGLSLHEAGVVFIQHFLDVCQLYVFPLTVRASRVPALYVVRRRTEKKPLKSAVRKWANPALSSRLKGFTKTQRTLQVLQGSASI